MTREAYLALCQQILDHDHRYYVAAAPTIADVEYATAGWVEWYNNRRLHSSLAMTTPAEYETAYYAALNRELAPT